MPISPQLSILIIVIVGITTFVTRAIPFLIFRDGKKIPETVKYLGGALPPAVIGMLVIYCLKDVRISGAAHGLPELIAVAAVVVLHVWKRNNLLSIGVGTVLYMFLVQVVF